MNAKTSLEDSSSKAEPADLPSHDAWATMDRATIEATIRVLADRGLDECFLVMVSGQSINDVRRILGRRL